MDVNRLAEVPHDAFKQATALLSEHILFGLGDDILGDLPLDLNEPDDTSNTTPGYGRLATSRDPQWRLMRHIMDTPSIFDEFFNVHDGIRKIHGSNVTKWLQKIEEFKSFIFILLHWLSGMPKRGTELIRLKIANIANRTRNFYSMYGYMAILGLYNKTSANTGRDNVTLHFIPQAVGNIILRFYYSAANVERWLVSELYHGVAGGQVDPHWDAYFFSSCGRRWTADKLSKILKDRCEAIMGVEIGLQRFRHIIPAITTHYSIGSQASPTFSIMHDQMGHGVDTGETIYARTTDGHHHLTNTFCHNSLDFCMDIHRLWGFHESIPSIDQSHLFRRVIVEKLSGVAAIRLQEEFSSIRSEMATLNTKLDLIIGLLSPTNGTRTNPLPSQIATSLVQNVADVSTAFSGTIVLPAIATAPRQPATMDSISAVHLGLQKGKQHQPDFLEFRRSASDNVIKEVQFSPTQFCSSYSNY